MLIYDCIPVLFIGYQGHSHCLDNGLIFSGIKFLLQGKKVVLTVKSGSVKTAPTLPVDTPLDIYIVSKEAYDFHFFF